MELAIRPYQPADRAQVRDICFRTGHMGDPVDWLWADQESFADLFTAYYTDAEPASAFVVEAGGDGPVLGYLLGCVDSSRSWRLERTYLRHMVRRGLLLRPGTAGVLWRTLTDTARDVAARRVEPSDWELADDRWPAHLHIDLLPAARGHGAGRRLIVQWLDRLRAHNVPGCHLGTFAENTSGIAFFESLGFRRHGDPVLAPGFRTRAGARMHSQVMVHDLDG